MTSEVSVESCVSDARAGVSCPRLRRHPAGRRTGRRFISGKSLHAIGRGCAALCCPGLGELRVSVMQNVPRPCQHPMGCLHLYTHV